ncbi:ATP-binding protein [bacterium]|nr:ATP-binding protein [bacterium]
MKKTMVLTLVLGSLISTSYSKHQDPKGLADLIGGAPELAVRFVLQMKRCKEAKELGNDSKEERYCDLDPILIEGKKGNGKTTLYRAMESDSGVDAHVLKVGNVGNYDTSECVRSMKAQVDYAAESAEASNTPRYVVIEEVEDYASWAQSGLKDLMDEEAYRGKIQFVLTTNNFAGLRGDIINRCGSNIIFRYPPEKEERRTYLEGFCDEFGLQPTKSQLKLLQESSNKLSILSLLLVIKNINQQCDGTEVLLSNDELKSEINAVRKAQEKYNNAHGLDPSFYERNKDFIKPIVVGSVVSGVGVVAAGVAAKSQDNIKNILTKSSGIVVKVVKAAPGVVIEGTKYGCYLVIQGVGVVWHIFF